MGKDLPSIEDNRQTNKKLPIIIDVGITGSYRVYCPKNSVSFDTLWKLTIIIDQIPDGKEHHKHY